MGAACITVGFLGLRRFTSLGLSAQEYSNQVNLHGPLIPDPEGILDLPEGFSYSILSRTGDLMSDGLRTPGNPDGMAAFPLNRRETILVRNHENKPDSTTGSPFGIENELLANIDQARLYDAGHGALPHLGGTTNVVYDFEARRVTRQFLSLAGTERNCAGGPTPWNSWISCEESISRADESNERVHGYNFEVPARAREGLVEPIPLKAMGRFNHEAVAVNPRTGVVYQTEDRGDGLIYRLLPEKYGDLQAGGRLQALVLKDKKSADTRNWSTIQSNAFPQNEEMDVEWIDLEEIQSPNDDLRLRGFEAGAARFARGEGMWYGREAIYFACTNGGKTGSGQIFRYLPSPSEGTTAEATEPGRLELFIEPNDTTLLESCDNLTVAPWGDLIICEDGPGEQYLRGYTPQGQFYTLAHNSYQGDSEMCGACFAPNHPTLFVNIQRPGITLAITGPWRRGEPV